MLTLQYPHLKDQLNQVSIGLWPTSVSFDFGPVVLAKLPKTIVLTAIDRGFMKLYFVPLEVRGVRLIGLTTAFFDDPDNPLVIRTLLFEDQLSSSLLEALLQPRFQLHLFDEHGRELAGFGCEIPDPTGQREAIRGFRRSSPDPSVLADAYDTVTQWFSHRDVEDDGRAFRVDFIEEIFPSDLFTIDLGDTMGGYAGAPLVAHHSLVQEDPGHYQEPDILRCLQRVFANEQLSLNPMRGDKPDKEFADALVLTPEHVIIVQAKDSPNTTAMLDRTLARKRAAGQGQMIEAANQLNGSIGYCRRLDPAPLVVGGEPFSLALTGRTILGIMVVRELFPDETERQLAAIDQVRTKTGVDAVVIDYPGLSVLTFHSEDSAGFLDAIDGLVAAARAGKCPDVTSYVLERYLSGKGRRPQ